MSKHTSILTSMKNILKNHLNIEYLDQIQLSGILKAMDEYAKYHQEKMNKVNKVKEEHLNKVKKTKKATYNSLCGISTIGAWCIACDKNKECTLYLENKKQNLKTN